MPIVPSEFEAPWWLAGPHVQTIYPRFVSRPCRSPWRPERLELPDGDFVDLQWCGPDDQPLVVLFHGLEGSGESGYIQGLRSALLEENCSSVLMHFRGCSGENNRMARGYHSGDTGDIGFLMQTLLDRFPGRRLSAAGFSLGGNALLKYLGECGEDCSLSAAVAVSVPFDLSRCAERLSTGTSRIYQRHLLGKLLSKVSARAELLTQAGVDVPHALGSQNFRQFDGRVVAPLFGFEDADDYYAKASCGPFLSAIQVPTLIIQAADDPFMSPEAIPDESDLSPAVTLELSARGGHVGFVSGARGYWLDGRITAELIGQAKLKSASE